MDCCLGKTPGLLTGVSVSCRCCVFCSLLKCRGSWQFGCWCFHQWV